ncbi:hypothetical protein GWN26_00225 [Candidatus Saccharibacteria bacterium]|nr:DUF167 domain-containing protein [Candidatus Saccharibacteria bacterium]NIV03711.1 hypothetical protein [Calditrichia bacterium]NIS37618.1 DUF167 domain-containing protein [Candidatus Saccharibacteria bacterium]NIV71199.1 hypothetical protein [Calditrichia bacterium]NIV97648.1 hypothetical protein [Candidatus Saccharibacteria bacterium]
MPQEIKIRVIPNAKRPEIIELEDGSLKIKLKSPAEGGRANKELASVLSRHYKTPKSQIKIIFGEKSRNKIIELA